MAYYPFWILLITLSLWASVGGFLWAYRNRQFNDQGRARYLPLRGEGGPILSSTGNRARREAMAMLVILALGVGGIMATVLVVAMRYGGSLP
jgi:nitrogen fixation-related uncharacterized protein